MVRTCLRCGRDTVYFYCTRCSGKWYRRLGRWWRHHNLPMIEKRLLRKSIGFGVFLEWWPGLVTFDVTFLVFHLGISWHQNME